MRQAASGKNSSMALYSFAALTDFQQVGKIERGAKKRIVGGWSATFTLLDHGRVARNSLQTRIDFGTLGAIRNANFLCNRGHSGGRTSSAQGGASRQ
jgi:hypothetical protein